MNSKTVPAATSIVSGGTTTEKVDSAIENVEGSPLINRAKSQVIKKRDRDYGAVVALSADQNDIRLGECPQSKVSNVHNNK